MSTNSDQVRDRNNDRAEAMFKKEQRLREGEQAMAEYGAEQRAVLEKTARLKALRLARDAALAGRPEGESALSSRKRP